MEVVIAYFERFVARFPDVPSLAAATDDEVTALWSGLGYYRRARMLREGAVDVMSRFDRVVSREGGALTSIPGIGRDTAGQMGRTANAGVAAVAAWQHSPLRRRPARRGCAQEHRLIPPHHHHATHHFRGLLRACSPASGLRMGQSPRPSGVPAPFVCNEG